MVTAMVLINTARGRTNEVAEALVALEGVSEAYSVGGRFDLVAVLRLRDNEALAELVTRRMTQIEGIERTETLIAFQVYSRHDLEHMFSIGME
ncbi:MAG: Lrp/AsnC ligand binding domain-containing protein [Armatimonadetes bacterium]|nr:Lrp/AsnC ligand binding domain-containing protein [Armatimonadota bacterium]